MGGGWDGRWRAWERWRGGVGGGGGLVVRWVRLSSLDGRGGSVGGAVSADVMAVVGKDAV